MKVRLFDKIEGVPYGTIKDLPPYIAASIVENGQGEYFNSPASDQPKPAEAKQVTKKSKNKIAKR